MNYRICFVCTGNACRSPFAECVTKELLLKEDIENIEVYSVGTLDWGSNPRDAVMVDIAGQLGYAMNGSTTAMTRENLLPADLIVVFEERHRDAITKFLDYSHWDRIVLFNTLTFGTNDNVEDPNFQSAAVYRRIAKYIESGCLNIVKSFAKNPPRK